MPATERDALESYLREQGLRMTSEREAILEAFLGIERHVTAEGLLEAVRRIDGRIGPATVFRTIKLLVDSGLAREAGEANGAAAYEHAFRHAHHDHLVCVGCGAVVEFEDAEIERAQERVFRKHGFKPESHRLELRGTCPKCAKRAKR